MSRTLREIWLFFWRDLLIARTYRAPFLLEAVEALFGTAMFYFTSRFVDSPELRSTLPQGLEEARDSGTLEHLLVTQTSLPAILAGSAIYPFVSTTLRIAVYLAWAALLFHFPLGAANWLAVAAVLLTSLLAFSGLGIFSASYLLLFKRGNPGKWLLLGISSVAGGMLFPVSILPGWLQDVARINPVTYTLEAMRSALLGGAELRQLWHPIAILLLFAALLLPLSMFVFAAVLRRTKTTGTLMHR